MLDVQVSCGQHGMAIDSTRRCVTLSTVEAECVALGEKVKEALFTGAVVSFIRPELRKRIMCSGFPG